MINGHVVKIKFIIDGNAVVKVYDVGDGMYVPVGSLFKYKGESYDNREDALYAKLIKDLEKGKPLENFKSSKYFTYYVKRLSKDNPEYLI